MNIRRITSLVAALSFLVMVLTSIVLYIVPAGRIAYWADWRLMGLSKSGWADIHINNGFLFLSALILHIYYNWKPIVNYLRDKSKNLKIVTPDFNASFIILCVVIVGTYYSIPPFSSILNLSEKIKDEAIQTYGEPPYGHAELSSLDFFSNKMKINVDAAMEKLNKDGITVTDKKLSLAQISRNNKVSPQTIYLSIKPLIKKTGQPAKLGIGLLPVLPPSGLGKMSIEKLSKTYGLKAEEIVKTLSKSNLNITKKMTLKEIASKNGSSPMEVFEEIRVAAQE